MFDKGKEQFIQLANKAKFGNLSPSEYYKQEM